MVFRIVDLFKAALIPASSLVTSLHDSDENFKLHDEGLVDKYLGIDIAQVYGTSFQLTQPFLIERITQLIGIDLGRTNKKLTPVGKPLLNRDLDGVPRKYNWEYCAAIGMLTYLTGSIRLDIAMVVHQCARFSTLPMRLHEQAVMRITKPVRDDIFFRLRNLLLSW